MCEWKVPQVTPLGSAWSDAENSPGHAGNGCCWAWLSSLFIFLFKKTLHEVLWRGGGRLLLGCFLFVCFLVQMDIFFLRTREKMCVCVCLEEHWYIPFYRLLSLQGKVVTFWRRLWILMNLSFAMGKRCLFKEWETFSFASNIKMNFVWKIITNLLITYYVLATILNTSCINLIFIESIIAGFSGDIWGRKTEGR